MQDVFLILVNEDTLHAVPADGRTGGASLCGTSLRYGHTVALARELHVAPASCLACLSVQNGPGNGWHRSDVYPFDAVRD